MADLKKYASFSGLLIFGNIENLILAIYKALYLWYNKFRGKERRKIPWTKFLLAL